MISIGLPAVKTEFLREALQSVMEQSYNAFELILVNDRKDVSIRDIALSFNDPRIRYYEEKNILPVTANWNRTLAYAQGEFFVLFADDDRYHPDFLLTLHNLTEQYPSCDLFHCRVARMNAEGKVFRSTPLCPEFETGLNFVLERLSNRREHFAPEFMVRTEALRAAGGFIEMPMAWGSDDLTWFTLALRCGVAYASEELVFWRESGNQISRSGNYPERLEAVINYSAWIEQNILTLKGRTQEEQSLLEQIRAVYRNYANHQKIYLMAMHACQSTWKMHFRFFLEHRKKYGLIWKWYFYAVVVARHQRQLKP